MLARHASSKSDMAIKAARASRLGLLASLALGRFVRLHRKYSEDQPRDEQGRWIETGAGNDVDTTGTTTLIDNSVRTGDIAIGSITQKLADKLANVIDALGEGSGPVYGTAVHSAFAEAVRNSGIPGLSVESTWLPGEPAPGYSLTGSVRADVVLRGVDDSAPVRAIWDVKTGEATLGRNRLDQLRDKIGVGREVPVIELNVRRGVLIKNRLIARVAGASA